VVRPGGLVRVGIGWVGIERAPGTVQAVLVHEWLTNMAGSEKVVGALRRTFPDAPLYTSMHWRPAFPDWDPVRTSFLQRFARGPRSHVRVLPAMPAAFLSLRLPPAPVTVTSFHTFATWARPDPSSAHIVYCHTPPRFLWAPDQLRDEQAIPAARRTLALVGGPLRRLDRGRARRPAVMVANSTAVASRIRDAYGRASEVVHPPVDIDRFASARDGEVDDYHLLISRLVPYKRVDLAIEAFAELGWPLVVAGAGRQEAALRARATANVTFAGFVPDADLPRLMARARALVMPGEEDFGITPVEAMAAGTPVVALARGGAVDTVQPGLSGILFDEPDVPSLVAALRAAAATTWDRAEISRSVRRFDEARFAREITDLAASVVD
jgi:glycosyltransferase involved in cell wall biosynthesis